MTEDVILEDGQFEVEGVVYELRFNLQKIKTVELMTKQSVSATTVNNNGVLPLQLMESLFTMSLVESKGLKAVSQKKATEIWEPFLEENGALTVNGLIVDKLQEDVGFLFR
ncbi:segregation and condensation protein B [Enterococcus dispar]|uniref:segregation and condensation protein B n=1 Tax=Enterococcus dispar TaxID=44009 RepID=UPI0021D40B0C|nr:segregation and condensation protein B [Enterococcus dispar]MCU7356694.1 segregation and condensation protein B [Enterococcus dispar]